MKIEKSDISLDSRLKGYFLLSHCSVKEAMRHISQTGKKVLLIVNAHHQLVGTLTDGDIRRWILSKGTLNNSVEPVCNQDPVVATRGFDIDEIKRKMQQMRIDMVPVVDDNRRVIDVLQADKIFLKETIVSHQPLKNQVVIMAGGKGARLDPFTRVLPKPLIPIGEKTILEIIMDKFCSYGIKDFYLSLGYRSHMIRSYFEETNAKYTIYYIEEKKPLGTIGSLHLLKDELKEPFIVTNCDIIIDCDLNQAMKFHHDYENDVTMVASWRHFVIPYGVCKIKNTGTLVSIEEKPEFDYLVNTGMYIMNRSVLNLIPPNQFFNVTDLWTRVQKKKLKVRIFPINEKSWIDIGQWDEYHKALEQFKGKA